MYRKYVPFKQISSIEVMFVIITFDFVPHAVNLNHTILFIDKNEVIQKHNLQNTGYTLSNVIFPHLFLTTTCMTIFVHNKFLTCNLCV